MNLPPRWADRLLEWFCSEDLLEDLQGDLYQRFNERIDRRGLLWAKFLFIVDVVSFLRPYIFRKNHRTPLFSNSMIHSYYQMAVRILIKRRIYSLINISGLALGMTAFVLINIYVANERSYDNFHVNRDRLYRLKMNSFSNGVIDEENAGVGAAVGPDLKVIFPEIKRFVRLRRNQVMLSYEDAVFRETGVFFASEDFFTIFSIPLLKGVDSLALREPWTMAMSRSMAKKYFRDEDPIGKVMTNLGRDRYVITAIFEDIPENSHLKIDAVFSFSSLELIFGKDKDPYLTYWGWVGYPTYIELDATTSPDEFERKLEKAVEAKLGKDLRTRNQWMSLELQPIQSIHLTSHLNHEIAPNSDASIVNTLSLIALVILLMAWLNYVNLSTARSIERAKEIGIRKVLGSSRLHLIGQFLTEAFFYNFLALVVAAILISLVLPEFGSLVGRHFHFRDLITVENLTFIVMMFLAGSLGSGLYPAFVLSSMLPAKVLKGGFKSSPVANLFRRGLVAIQFGTATILITGVLTIDGQLNYLQRSPVGINLEQVLVVEGPIVTDSLYDMRFTVLKNDMLLQSGMEAITASSAVPGRSPRSGSNVRLQREDPTTAKSFNVLFIDEDFANTFGLGIKEGRNFSHQLKNDRSVLVNETGMKALGIYDPQQIIGEKILVYGDSLTVIGILKDYHYKTLRDPIEPAVYLWDPRVTDFYSFRIQNPESVHRMVDIAEASFKKQFPGNQFNYFFLDDLYNQLYKSEQQFFRAFGIFSVVGIFIACLGLYGLSSYLVLLRTREIGVRKIFGASTAQILFMILQQFVVVVLLANVFFSPLSWWLMDTWLSTYANRINLTILMFLIPTLVVVAIAISTVVGQAIKAATANPINAIREN